MERCDVNKQTGDSAMSDPPKVLEKSGRYKSDKDGFDDSSEAGRR